MMKSNTEMSENVRKRGNKNRLQQCNHCNIGFYKSAQFAFTATYGPHEQGTGAVCKGFLHLTGEWSLENSACTDLSSSFRVEEAKLTRECPQMSLPLSYLIIKYLNR